jgi:LacI family transcriptional regulator
MIERTLDLPLVDRIQVDDLNGAKGAVGHIIAKGHRRIGFIGSQTIFPHSEVENLRYQGYISAFLEANLDMKEEYVCLTSNYSAEAGYQAAEALIQLPSRPTAIFATSDLLIAGVLQCFQKYGIKVPEDISLVGYDDTLSALLPPPITSVGLAHETIGEQALLLIQERLSDRKAPSQSILIDTVLIDRNSVKDLHQNT